MKKNSTASFLDHPAVSSSDFSAASVGERYTRGPLFRRMVVSMFRQMDRGRMVMSLPDGSQLAFGQPLEQALPTMPEGLAATAQILVKNERFFRRCVLAGDIGFGESFVDGDWDTQDLPSVIAWFLLNLDNAPTLSGSARRLAHGWLMNVMRFSNRVGHLLRPNSEATAKRNIREHYDVSNAFFQKLLDPTMMYSSAIWDGPDDTLAQAQTRKNEALCTLLKLRPTDHVLEIGTGWGGWSIHAASKHGCRVTSLTISEEQYKLAKERIACAGVDDRVDVQLVDFRSWHGTYDKIVSIEMMEALGHQYLPVFCEFVSRSLKPDGLMALQFITYPDARYQQLRKGVDFIQKHIFPGSLLLSLNRVNEQLTRAGGFVMNQLTDYGPHYAKTLNVWNRTLSDERSALAEMGFGETFFRRWTYYFQYCEAAFAMRNISVVQTLHTRPNNLSLPV